MAWFAVASITRIQKKKIEELFLSESRKKNKGKGYFAKNFIF